MISKNKKRLPKLIPAKPRKQARIGKREIDILKSLAEYRFLTAEQIRKLHFPKGSRSYCNARLRALFHKPHRLVDRHPLPMEWGKGSPKLAYSLTKKGADRLSKEGFYTRATYQSVYKLKKGTPFYKKHEIAVNEFRISVQLAADRQGWKVEEWIAEAEFKDPALLRRMRVYDPEKGRNIPVAPDGFFSLYFPKLEQRALFFLELDRGTMENARFRYKKIRGYHLFGEKWRELEEFRKYRNLPITFRVLTVVDGGAQRMMNLKEKGAETEFLRERRKDRLAKSWRFYFTTLGDVSPETIFTKPIWMIPYRSRTKDERFELIDFDREF